MRLVKYSHACVRIESDAGVLVIDPGGWSERQALDGVDAVLITHEHPDHIDVDAVEQALLRHPAAQIFTNAAVADRLAGLGDAVITVSSGDRFDAAGLPVQAYGGWHAEIHPDLPRVQNLAYLVDQRVYHPGDSFDPPIDSPIGAAQVQVLFVPISGAWLRLAEAVEFVRSVRPQRVLALHDCLLSPVGLQVTDANMAGLTDCGYTRLVAGESIELGPRAA